jgi:riboflavin synthase alpha subunit
MFTGLIREVGRLEHVSLVDGVSRLRLHAPACADRAKPGDSLAVNGICLTVTAAQPPWVGVEATAETRRVTTLSRWRLHDLLHLEPALRVGDQLGGHLVYGHVDGTGRILRLARRGRTLWMTVALAPALSRQLLPKAAIAVDGVSLTLDAGPFPGRFTVTLIPHTLLHTRFGRGRVGERVNIEIDVLTKAATRPLTVGAITARGWDPHLSNERERA